jgi:hypothetical protein
MMSRKKFGPKWATATGDWRKLHRSELHVVLSSPNITRMIKSRRMRRAVHVKRTGRGEMHVGFRYGKLRERDHLKDVGVDFRISLKWKLKK